MWWIIVSLLSRLSFATSNVLDSHFRHVTFKDAYTQNFCGTLYYLLIVPALFLIAQPVWPAAADWPWLIVGGVLMNLYLIPYYEAMKWSDSSSVTSLFTLSRVFSPILAFFILGEQLSLRQYIGFGVVLAGAFLLSYDRKVMKITLKPILLMALSGILVSLSIVFTKHVFNHMRWLDAFSYLVLFASITAFVPYLLPSKRAGITKGVKEFPGYAVPMGLNVGCGLAGNTLFNYALSLTLVSYVSMIGMFQPFFVMGISYIAYRMGWLNAKESFHPHDMAQKIASFVIMTAGVLITLWDVL
jgi:transporter family protein